MPTEGTSPSNSALVPPLSEEGRERLTSGAATAILLAATSALVASGSQPQALLGAGWLKSTWDNLKHDKSFYLKAKARIWS